MWTLNNNSIYIYIHIELASLENNSTSNLIVQFIISFGLFEELATSVSGSKRVRHKLKFATLTTIKLSIPQATS